MTPYEDSDLAALVLGRGLVDEERLRRAARLCASAAPRTGALARALVDAGLLDRAGVDAALAELQRFVVVCEGCARRFCALPGDRPRRVACPACRRPRDLPGHADVPPTVVPRRRAEASSRGSQRLARGPGAGDEATLPLPGSQPGRRRPTGTVALPGRERAARGPGSDAGREATMALPGSERPGRPHPASARLAATGGETPPLPGSDAGVRASGGPGPDGGLTPGDRVGPYEVEREISRGAMGVVLRARHVEITDRVVAIKVMAADLGQDPDGLRRFQREGEVLASMDHPHVVRVYDAGRLPDGRPYLAMDYVEGATLEHLARERGPLPLAEAAGLLEVVARGVAYMNARGVVHRDLKLGNVLLDASGAPCIADLGLAYVAGAASRITQQGDLLGTPLYMAPEVVRGEGGVDGRIDVYALGVMLFRLVTGGYPFYADSSVALFDLVLHAHVTYPADLGPDARAVLERALARDRELRYPDASALADDLAALAAARPVSARPIGRGERLRRALRGSPGRVALVALALVAGLLVAGGLWVVRRWPARRATRAVAGLEAALTRERAALLQGGPAGPARELLARARRVRAPGHEPAPDADARAGAGADPGVEREELAGGAWDDVGRELLAAAGRGDDAALGALARLDEAQAALTRVLERVTLAREVAALRAEVASPDADRLQALLARARALATPSGQGGERSGDGVSGAFLGALGWLQLSCGDPAAARATLGRAAGVGAGEVALAAWAGLRAGADEALARDGGDGAPGVDAATRVALALAARGRDPSSAWPERARAALADVPHGPRRALLAARLAWLGEPSRGDPLRLLEHLAAARSLSDTPEQGPVPPAIQGQAALLEGEVLSALGWWASAAHALSRAEQRLGPEPTPCATIEVGTPGGPVALVAPRTAARLLRARALSRGIEPAAALAAADDAVAWARLDGATRALAEALALRAEALALLEREVEARAALTEARQAPGGGQVGEAGLAGAAVAARVEARLALWRDGAAPGWLPGADAPAAASLLAEAEGALREAVPVDPARAPELDMAAAAGCVRARRGFALAAALATDARALARAWAGQARARLFAGDTDGAAIAAERAARADPGARETAQARALVRAVRGVAGAPEELLAHLEALAGDASVRSLQRAPAVLIATCEAAWALRASADDAARVADRAEALLAAERAPPLLRERLLMAALRQAARASAGRERLDALEARLKRLERAAADDMQLARVARSGSDGSFMAQTEAAVRALHTLLERYPSDPIWYEELYARGAEIRAWGFDCLVLAFELRPGLISQRGNAQRQHNDVDGDARGVTREAMPKVIASDAPSDELPVRRDDDLRLASVIMFSRELEVPLETEQVLAALAAAERFVARQPASASGWLAAGYLRLDVGDPGGALVALERAAALYPSLDRRRDTDRCWAHFYAALAHGALRRWDEAAAALRRAAEAGLWYAERLRDPRLSDERSRAPRPELEAFAERLRKNDSPRARR